MVFQAKHRGKISARSVMVEFPPTKGSPFAQHALRRTFQIFLKRHLNAAALAGALRRSIVATLCGRNCAAGIAAATHRKGWPQ